MMKIHAIQTGTVAVTRAWREGVGHGKRRLVNTIRDGEWTEPLPIYAFAIEHPEGVIVVDTGETAGASQPGYFPSWHPFLYRYRLAVEKGRTIVHLDPGRARRSCGTLAATRAARGQAWVDDNLAALKQILEHSR